jgi:hypothetical protein
MPFTLAHPAAAVPLARFGLPLSALVVGSMAPDFPYFYRLSTSDQSGHTLLGLFTYCLPAGFVALLIYHKLLKRYVLSFLPAADRARLSAEFRFGPISRLLLIAIAIVLGAATHIAWDSFTHAHGWIVERLPMLQAWLFRAGRSDIRMYKVLQHGSTVVGLLLLCIWYRRWHQRSDQTVPSGP